MSIVISASEKLEDRQIEKIYIYIYGECRRNKAPAQIPKWPPDRPARCYDTIMHDDLSPLLSPVLCQLARVYLYLKNIAKEEILPIPILREGLVKCRASRGALLATSDIGIRFPFRHLRFTSFELVDCIDCFWVFWT